MCGVSGGADSLALLVLAVAVGCRVTAVHVDHGLREGSQSEAALVAAVAEQFGARFRSERVSLEPGTNLEARGRAARHGILGPDAALGHTADDRAETILMNLLRGAGPDGLAGIRPGPRHPIVELRRSETEAVCAIEGLEPFFDPTNLDPMFLRHRVRSAAACCMTSPTETQFRCWSARGISSPMSPIIFVAQRRCSMSPMRDRLPLPMSWSQGWRCVNGCGWTLLTLIPPMEQQWSEYSRLLASRLPQQMSVPDAEWNAPLVVCALCPPGLNPQWTNFDDCVRTHCWCCTVPAS